MSVESGRSRAGALILLFALLAGIIAVLSVPALLKWQRLGTEIEAARAKIAKKEDIDRARLAVVNVDSRWNAFASRDEAGFVRAGDADLPRVTEETLRRLAQAHDGEIRKAIVLGSEDRPNLVTVEIDAVLPRAKLLTFLYDIESKSPFVILRSLKVKNSGNGAARVTFSGTAFGLDIGVQG